MNYIHYGCGHEAPEGWQNYDSSPTLILERFPLIGRFIQKNNARFPTNVRRASIVKGLPVSPASADAVYCSHTLEHLALDELRTALRNTYAMLKPGGVFRCVLPDLEFFIKAYTDDMRPTSAIAFMENTMLGVPRRAHGPVGFLKDWLGGSHHLWMWDYKALSHELSSVGFTGIRRAVFGDSGDPMFTRIEQAGRWHDSLGIHCRRPL